MTRAYKRVINYIAMTEDYSILPRLGIIVYCPDRES